MRKVKEASRYAKALIRNVPIDDVPQALVEISTINELMNKSKAFKSLLVNPSFTTEERAGVIKSLSQKIALSENTVKLIVHLSEIGAILALSDIIRIATNLYLDKKKKAKATVLTPIEISSDQDSKLKMSLKALTDRDVDIEYVIDPSLLGGILVKMGSAMYDTSIRSQLRLLKDELIKG